MGFIIAGIAAVIVQVLAWIGGGRVFFDSFGLYGCIYTLSANWLLILGVVFLAIGIKKLRRDSKAENKKQCTEILDCRNDIDVQPDSNLTE